VASKRRRRPAAAKRAGAVAQPVVAPEPEIVSKRGTRPVRKPDPLGDTRWTPAGLAVLLGLVFILQIPIGVFTNVTSHANPLIIDLFFFQPQYLVVACVLLMPLARRLTHQQRNLRLLESLSLGIMYALLALMLGTAFVHPANANEPTTLFISHLKLTDGLLLAGGDLLGLVGTVYLYPGFSRLLSAPGRRARARMLERTASSQTRSVPRRDPPAGRPRNGSTREQ
jgi:hypothetical protein